MRFREIVEAYAHGFKTFRGQQCDVYTNPTRKEFREISEKGTEAPRAFLVGKDLLAWNCYSALHQMVREEMKLPDDVISVILYGMPGQEVDVQVTDNVRYTPWMHNPSVADAICMHPYIRRTFSRVTVSYFDENIVGDWETMGNEEDDEDEDEDDDRRLNEDFGKAMRFLKWFGRR